MAASLEKTLQEMESGFIPAVKESCKENLVSVLLYGSAVRGGFKKGVSDVNVLVLTRTADAVSIRELGDRVKRMARKYRITPHFLTVDGFINSADIFPIEYLDIIDSHRILFGDDVTEKLDVVLSNLRHQVEDRLRGNLTTFRQFIMTATRRKRVIENFLKNWYGSQAALFRGLLRLKGISPLPTNESAILTELKKNFSINTAPFNDLLALRNGEKIDAEKLTYRIHDELTTLTIAVDELNV